MTEAFMVLAAPLLISFAVIETTRLAAPGLFPSPDVALTRDYVGLVALLGCIISGLHFALISVWSNWLGAGPFVGEMSLTTRWLWLALILGPLILVVPTLGAEALMRGQENWVYSEAYDPAWNAPENRSAAALFYILLLAPVAEEVTYRGVAIGAMLARGINPVAAVVISSGLFALIHQQYSPAAMAVVFIAGLGFGGLRVVSGTMAVPIIAHIAANAFVLALAG